MAFTTNTVTMVGNLTKDLELRYTASGSGVASANIAVNRSWKKNGEWEEEVSFFTLTIWSELAENAAQSLSKGDSVIVTGRMQQRSYDDREGNKRSVTEMVVDAIGPNLRFATCEVAKIERSKGGSTEGGSTKKQAPIYGEPEPFLVLADISDIEAVNRRGNGLLVRPWN